MKKDPDKKTVYYLLEDAGNHDIFYDKNSRKDCFAVPYIALRKAIEQLGYNFCPTFDYKGLKNYQDVAYILSNTLVTQDILESLSNHPERERCFLFINEPYTTYGHLYHPALAKFFGKIFVMFEEIVDNQTYFHYLHPQGNEAFVEHAPPFQDKKFCAMVQTNHTCDHPQSSYLERKKGAEFFTLKGEFDLYGAGWHGFSSWRGAFKTGKVDLLKHYEFSLCYENISDQCGYITERIFDAFYAKSLPIYLGPKNIYDYIPKECFINRKDFGSYEELYLFLKEMSPSRYEEYLKNIEKFLKSPKSGIFGVDQLARTVVKHL